MMSRSRMALATMALAGLALGAALGGHVQAAEEINVYSARHYDTDRALYDGFTEATGVTVNLLEASADALIERMRQEGANSPADVLITVDAGRLWRAQEAGLLQPVQSALLEEAIPSSLREPDGYWFGLSTRARVIIYAKDRVDPGDLSTYEALADDRWEGRVLIRSSTNVYNQSLTGSILAALGPNDTEAWAARLVENFARRPQGGDTDQIRAVAAGEGDVAIANHYYLARLAASSDEADQGVVEKVGIFFPNQDSRGTHVNISGAGVAANAPHRDAAIRFIEYLASPSAQAKFAESNFEYPAVVGVGLHPVIAAWGDFKRDELNAGVFGRNNAEALKIMDRAGWR